MFLYVLSSNNLVFLILLFIIIIFNTCKYYNKIKCIFKKNQIEGGGGGESQSNYFCTAMYMVRAPEVAHDKERHGFIKH